VENVGQSGADDPAFVCLMKEPLIDDCDNSGMEAMNTLAACRTFIVNL
jgi:hypothetical protein